MIKEPMNKLEQHDLEQARPLFAELAEIHLHLHAVLDGYTPGVVYADDLAQPRTVCMISGDAVYVSGVTDNQAFNAAVNAQLPRDRYFVLFCDVARWQDALDDVLRGTYAVRASRRHYVFDQPRLANWQDQIPDGFSMQRIDAELLAQDLENRDSVVAGILGEWQSVDLFLERTFGFCLLHGTEIASWSLTDYVRGDRCEIGIATDWHHRRQGLGTLTAAANAAHACACGFSSIGWHCWDNNAGSIAVAEHVGFRQSTSYDVFINHWAAENISDMTQDEFQVFAEFYERELETRPPVSGFPHVVTAKAWALSGNREGCFRHLYIAVDMGWLRDVEHLRQIWPELWFNPNLERTPQWQELVSKFETSAAKH